MCGWLQYCQRKSTSDNWYLPTLQRSVLLPGKENRLPSLEACRAACLAEAACTAWLYCWRPGGCDDGIVYNNYWCANCTLSAQSLEGFIGAAQPR